MAVHGTSAVAVSFIRTLLVADFRAEREGFEPSDPVTQVNSLAVNPIRPLSHLSLQVSGYICLSDQTLCLNFASNLLPRGWVGSK